MSSKLGFYFGNPWVGMFVKTNNETTLVPLDAPDKFVEQLGARLGTEVVRVSVGYSNLIGIYLAMNSKGIILPNIASEEEAGVIKRTGLNVYVSKDKFNALGNNLLVTDHGGIASDTLSREELHSIEDTLGIEIFQPATIAGYKTVGSAAVASNKGFLAHFNTQLSELELIRKHLKINGAKGSINMGVGFIGYAVVANDHGYVAGGQSSSFELGRIEEALQYI